MYYPEYMAETLRGDRLRLDELIFSPEGIAKTKIDGVLVVKRGRNSDPRGSLQEDFQIEDVSKAIGEPMLRVWQSQSSYSVKDVLRGMHAGREDKFCVPAWGRFFVAVVDVRKSARTFGESLTFELDATNPVENPTYGYFVRRGIAHGFLVLDTGPFTQAKFSYMCTARYDKEKTSGGFIYNDPQVRIDWPKNIQPLLSDKDAVQPSFKEFTDTVDQKIYE